MGLIKSFEELVKASDKELFKELNGQTIDIFISDDSDQDSNRELFEIVGVNFIDCDIRHISYARFKNCEFERCTIHKIDNCDIRRTNRFDSCTFFNSLMYSCIISDVVFNRCRFECICRFDSCGLSKANFHFCSGGNMNFVGCDLRNASFEKTDLTSSLFKDCDMEYLNFHSVDLYCASLSGNKNMDKIDADIGTKFFRLQCPEVGSFVAWKKVRDFFSQKSYIVKLLIPEDAKRSSATSYKCRAEFVKVLGIYEESGTESAEDAVLNRSIISMSLDRHIDTDYVVGRFVYPDSFDEDRWKECSHGIHFFMNFEVAKKYNA